MSWCLVFLFFKGPTAQRTVFIAWPVNLFLLLFCVFFSDLLFDRITPKSSQNGSSQTAKNHKKLQKKVTETHPQSGPVKRLSLAGAKPLKLTTLTTLSAVFPKAQSSQSRAKMERKWGPRAPKIMKNLKHEHLKKQQKKIYEKLDRVPILVSKTVSFFAAGAPQKSQKLTFGPQVSPKIPRDVPLSYF